jgi:uncharacterized membrane protein
MAFKTSQKDRQPPDRTARPSLAGKLMIAAAAQLLAALGEFLLACAKEKKRVPPARCHWPDVVDLDAAAPPLKKNPSSWSHRVKVAILAAVGALIAAYLSLYQLDLISSVWDPVFGPGTERVLTSDVSRGIERIFHVPDALLGALAYSTEILLTLSGSTRRWQYRPWIVALFGLNVLGLACVGAALIAAQGLIVKSGCFLCLITALISFVLLLLSAEEVYASLHYLWRVWRRSGRTQVVWSTFWGQASDLADDAAQTEEPGPERDTSGSGATGMWPRVVEIMLGLWLMLGPLIFRLGPADRAMTVNHLVYGTATVVASLIAIRFPFIRAVIVAIGLWLLGYGYAASGYFSAPGCQNLMIVGTLLCVLGIIPTDCLEPPRSWREYYATQRCE